MSLNLPRTRFLRPATSSFLRPRPILLPQRRTLFEWIHGRRKDDALEAAKQSAPFDPDSLDFKKRIADSRRAAVPVPDRKQGDLASSSIFDDGTESGAAPDASGGSSSDASPLLQLQLDPYLTAPKLDPAPKARARWLRKQVAQAVRKQGAISKDVARRRREREHSSAGEWLPTSQKKLMLVARQIAGKTVDEALVQLRFSKKKVAQDVARNLVVARQQAILGHAMGLGAVARGSTGPGSTDTASSALTASTPPTAPKPVTIIDKKGKRRTIADPSTIYIDQAWINRGPYGRVPEYRARGKMNILRPPYTRIAFLLKEEKTLLRQAEDRAAKAQARKPWVHHPDRPIQQKSQFVLW